MIYSQQRFYVQCDRCGKTIETNAADERIASETAKRAGWYCNTVLSMGGIYHKPKNVNLCPKCKEELNEPD